MAMRVMERLSAYILVGITSLSLMLVAYMLSYAHAGLDITDEGYYLSAISRPWEQGPAIRLFGFFYHPFYWVAQGNIVFLRQLNLLSLYGAAVAMFWVALRSFADPNAESARYKFEHLALSIILATAVLQYFQLWLPTPSYNSLVLLGCMLAMTMLLLIQDPLSARAWPWAGLGGAGWVIFMAKPPSAAFFGVFSLLYLALNGRFLWRGVLISGGVACTLLLLTAFFISASPIEFVKALLHAIEFEKSMGVYYHAGNIFRIDEFLSSVSYPSKIHLIASLACLALFLLVLGLLRAPAVQALYSLLCLGTLTIFLGLSLGWWSLALVGGATGESLLVFSCTAICFCWGYRLLFSAQKPVLKDYLLPLLVLTVPLICSFATSNNHWYHGSWASVFWVLAPLYSMGAVYSRRLLFCVCTTLSIFVLGFAVLSVTKSMNNPYRQVAPLSKQSTRLVFDKRSPPLYVSQIVYDYVTELRNVASAAGFSKGDPLLDFSGITPSAAYALNAKPVGAAWLLGLAVQSESYAHFVFSHIPCSELARTWVINFSDNYNQKIEAILSDYGLSLKNDMTIAGYLPETQYSFRRAILYKPTRPYHEALAACEAVRKNDNMN